MTDQPRAAIYARFSSDKQDARSIVDQIALCRAVAAREGIEVVGVYEDHALSGASIINRMSFQRLMRDAKAGRFAIVITEALDRLSRDQADLADMHRRLKFLGVHILTAHDGVAGALHVGVKGLLGALYLQDLARQVRRGQAGVLRDGRHNGGRSFGYRPVTGQAGVLEVVGSEAATVLRIFADYLAGKSARVIAAALNGEAVPGPRGGHWNASTIAGSKQRRNGILQNELYAGRIVWNRQRFVKDPDTGKRVSRPNPVSEWMTAPAEHLRIVDEATWLAVQTLRSQRSGKGAPNRQRYLLSGLIKCGHCGSGYIVASHDRRGGVLSCSRARETGLCDNKRGVARATLEDRVIAGLEQQLAAPELIAEYVREFHKTMRELNAAAAASNRKVDSRLAEVNASIKRTVDQLVDGTPSRALRERLSELERQRDELEAQRADSAPEKIEFHPNAAAEYRRKVRDLKSALVDATGQEEALRQIRELVEKIVIYPRGPHLPVDIEIHGQLAAMLRVSEQAVRADVSAVGLVAGIGFEPMTFRL